MKRNSKFHIAVIALYGIVAALFLMFFVYMGLFENVSVYQARETHSYMTVEDYSAETIPDETAPAGVRTVYRWTLDAADTSENCLCFYVVHHHVQVYYDGELMYSLMPSENNRIGSSISSNWVTVPVLAEDHGKEVAVVLTPLFESVIDHEVEFLLGSHFSIIFGQLTQDLPQLFLSLLCILLGIFIMVVQLYFVIRMNTRAWDMFFLGSFSVLLGFWRITDAKSSPILFSGNTMVLGYITIGALFLCCIPLLLFTSTLFRADKSAPLLILSLVGAVVAFITLLFQVLGIADFKEMLPLSHIMLIATVCAVLGMAFAHRRRKAGYQINKTWKYFLLLAVGILLDLISFYVHKSSSDVIYSIIAFVLWAIIVFITSVLDTTRKAYTDSRTGLANKARWNELMNDPAPVTDSIGVMMLDLNGLKHINDTLGHEAGDRMIFNFSGILRNTLPPNSVICRWGGDEFAVMITGMSREKMEQYVSAVHSAVDDYNASCGEPSIFFAAGYALSGEHPGLSRKELLSVADNQMYQNKQKWYSQNQDVF